MQHLISLYLPGQRDQLTTDAQRGVHRHVTNIVKKREKFKRKQPCCILLHQMAAELGRSCFRIHHP